jgi:hypothetical protein
MNCGGARGQRTEFWRSLSYHLGDFLADEVCRWVDRTEDGGQTIAAVESTARRGGGRALREIPRKPQGLRWPRARGKHGLSISRGSNVRGRPRTLLHRRTVGSVGTAESPRSESRRMPGRHAMVLLRRSRRGPIRDPIGRVVGCVRKTDRRARRCESPFEDGGPMTVLFLVGPPGSRQDDARTPRARVERPARHEIHDEEAEGDGGAEQGTRSR